MAARLREWAAAEVAPGRLMPCLSVGYFIILRKSSPAFVKNLVPSG
jgi:hypothetical protein